jgi:hypothetical protein
MSKPSSALRGKPKSKKGVISLPSLDITFVGPRTRKEHHDSIRAVLDRHMDNLHAELACLVAVKRVQHRKAGFDIYL